MIADDALRLLPPHPRPDRHARRRSRPGARRRAAGAALRDDRRPHRLPGGKRVRLSLHAWTASIPAAATRWRPSPSSGVVAGATERLRLVTSVLVLPYRNPVLTAKMVASLDVLSGGRVTLGVGVGWLKEEFEALDSPDFDARGAVTDEWIAIFKQLWSQSPASFTGQFYRLCRHSLRTLPAAEAASADLGRRPFPRRAAPHRAAWRWLAPGRRHRRLAVAAAGDARASRHAEAADGSRGARFLGAHDLLQGAAVRHRHPGSRRHPPQLLRQARRTSPATSAPSRRSACTS